MNKPNVVIVLCDQLRSFDVGCYGSGFVNTPNIDKLAANGIRFEHAVTNSPVCTPARSNLLSGQYCRTCVGARWNEINPESMFGRNDRLKHKDPTLAEQFKKLGYKTAQIGKWHIDTKPSLMGFDESLIVEKIFTKGNFYKNEGPSFDVPGFTADYEITAVKKYIKEHKDEPFFLYYNITSPHMPILDVPYKYSHMYDPKKVPLRENVWKDGEMPYHERWFYIYLWQEFYGNGHKPVTAKMPPDFTLKHLTALYDGLITWTDDLLGEMMKSLKENGIEEDTIVIFTADHGDQLGSHHLWNKSHLYEESISVPMVFSWPKQLRKGIVNKGQVTSLTDVMPTLLELCGGEIPQNVQGKNLAPILHGQRESLDENYAFIETQNREIAIRTPTHLYGAKVNPQDSGIEDNNYMFFDLTEDPYEQNNMSKTSLQKDIAMDLREKLIAWDNNTSKLTGVQYEAFGKLTEKICIHYGIDPKVLGD